MSVLVAYATRHGATAGIADRIAARLRIDGIEAESTPVSAVRDARTYDAFVIGSALYMFHWLGPASDFVRRNTATIDRHPAWLFSSGPIGTDLVDAQGRDVRSNAGPREIGELMAATHALDHHVFFGAYDPAAKASGVAERFLRLMPAAKASFPSGDFRDWGEIDAWADAIATELRRSGSGSAATSATAAAATR